MQQESTSVENRFSELARSAALVRALAARDEREEIRGSDSIAEAFLADDRKDTLDDPNIREWLITNYLPRGVYPYAIARTAYFDHIVAEALRENIPQLVIIGAGYDSRPYRFSPLIGDTVIFELDDPAIQERKRNVLKRLEVEIPDNVRYAPLTYDPTLLGANLSKAGYDREKPSLFVWEGISYHLTGEEVDKTLRFIAANAPCGSTLCFDYNSRSPQGLESDIGKELSDAFNVPSSAYQGLFAIEDGKTGVFLAERDFLIIEQLTAGEMDKRFLTLKDGSMAGNVPYRHNIAYASISK